MAARKKPAAELRTIGLFTGRTTLEEAQLMAEEEAASELTQRTHEPRDLVKEAEDCAVRWLGMDAFASGDDVKIAVHPKGHAVMVLVATTKDGSVRGTSTIKLSATQWKKLKACVKESER